MARIIPINTTELYDYGALFSADNLHRYSLWRFFRKPANLAAFIGCNPSTADAENNDPTVNQCHWFAWRWGFDGYFMLNFLSYRATDPGDLNDTTDKNRDENWPHILRVCQLRAVTEVVCAWGAISAVTSWHDNLLDILCHTPRIPHPMCFGRTKNGHPRHPLYLRKDTELEPV